MAGLRLGSTLSVGSAGKPAYDADAVIMFNNIGDVPTYAKTAISNRIKAFKANGTWSGMKVLMFMPPSEAIHSVLYDTVTQAQLGDFYLSATQLTTPYITRSIHGGATGMQCNDGSGHVKTGWIPSTAGLTLNSTAWAVGLPETIAASAQFSFGSFNSSTQSMVFQKRNTSNQTFADMYGTTTTSGRAQQTSSTGAGGVFIANRQSSTNYKLFRDGTQIASTSAAQGSLPSVEWYLRGFNNNGGAYSSTDPKNDTYTFFNVYGTHLTDAQLTQENADWQTYVTAMKRTGSYTSNVITDGDSHNVYYASQVFRSAQYYVTGKTVKWVNLAVSGQTLQDMETDAATELYPRFNSSYGTNILVVEGGTNDISSGQTAAQTYTRLETYINNAKAYCTTNSITLKVIVVPLIARRFTGDTGKILVSDQYQELLLASSGLFDTLVDIMDGTLWLKRSNYANDAAYITAIQSLCDSITTDDTHLTQANYKLRAVKYYDAINTHLV